MTRVELFISFKCFWGPHYASLDYYSGWYVLSREENKINRIRKFHASFSMNLLFGQGLF